MNTETPDTNPPDLTRPSSDIKASGTDEAEAGDEKRPDRGRVPSCRGALVIGAAATLMLVTLLVVALTNPDGGAHRHEDPAGSAVPAKGAPMVGHIHGIVPDPTADERSERVLVGAHYGLFAVDTDGNVDQVSADAADYMALTAAEPGRLLASGHPEPADTSRAINLGLVESRDGGRTWDPRSLDGDADFHALEHTPGRTWGIDAVNGVLLTSTNETTWDTVHNDPLIDLAVNPDDPDQVLATTSEGHLVTISSDGEAADVNDAPWFAFIDWPTPNVLVGVGVDGVVFRSDDGGGNWTALAEVPGDPTAVAVVGNTWFAATSDGLFRGPTTADELNEGVKHVLAYTS